MSVKYKAGTPLFNIRFFYICTAKFDTILTTVSSKTRL